jgi:hypothetical protein
MVRWKFIEPELDFQSEGWPSNKTAEATSLSQKATVHHVHQQNTSADGFSGIFFIQYVTDTSQGPRVLYPSPFLSFMFALKHVPI